MVANKNKSSRRGARNPQLDRLMQQAVALHAQGRLQKSEIILRDILQKQPRYADAWHLLGLIAHQVGNLDQALDLVGKAIALNEKVPLFHANRGEMCRQAGRLESALAHGRKAVQLAPRTASAHCNLGLAWYSKQEYEKARECQERALSLEPNLPSALNSMGSILRELHDAEAAMDFYRRAVAADPYYVEPLSNLGAVLVMEERYEEAVVVLSNALAIDDDYAEAHCNLGFALKNLERFEESFAHFQKTLQISPDYPEAYVGLGKIYQEKDQLDDAEQMALKAIELLPDNVEAYTLLGTVCVENNDPGRAFSSFDKALELNPESVCTLNSKGVLCTEMGDFTAAEALFKKSLDVSAEEQVAARFHLVHMKKATREDDNIAALLEMEKALPTFAPRKQLPLHFALGKVYDDLGDYSGASAHFLSGSKLKRGLLKYDPKAQEQIFDTVKTTFERERLEELRSGGSASELPVFILGMPRSGTTLVEQILASHPDVHGGGELREIPRITKRSIDAGGGEACFPDNLEQLSPDLVSQWATDYLSVLQDKCGAASRVTDKMPGNFLFLGLLRCMFPAARIIHVQRNPLDTCLSCFTHLFQRGQDYSYDLAELGNYYRRYHQLMEHWQASLPEGSYLNVDYEELVRDPEGQSRRLVEYCGLDWNPECLDFYRHGRQVSTASAAQVRQPIYRSSLERWRNYEEMLAPLIKSLGPLASLG